MASSLDLLQFQPIRFGYTEETCANNDPKEYCRLVQDGDDMYLQLRRTLGTNAITCDMNDVDATQLLTDPSFTVCPGAWVLGGWACSGGGSVTITAAPGSFRQDYGAMVDKAIYQINVVTRITTTVGDLEVYLCDALIGTIPENSVAATYTFYGVANTGVNTRVKISTEGNGGSNATAEISDVTMYRAVPCLTVDVTTGTFSYDPVLGMSINGTVQLIIETAFEPSSIYSPQTTLFISGYSTGTVTFDYGADTSGAIDGSNGTMTFTNNSVTNTNVEITFQDFIGTLETFEVDQLSSDYFFALYDLNNTYVRQLNSFVGYCQEYISVSFNPQDEGFAYGCYKIGLYDPYLHTDQAEFTYDFTTLGVAWAVGISGTVWALTPGVGEEFTPGSASGAIHTAEANTDTSFAWVKLKFHTGTITDAVGANMNISLTDATLATMATLQATSPASDTTYQSATEMDPTVAWSALGNLHPKLSVTAAQVGDNLIWETAYYKAYPYHVDYYSTCFTYEASIPCSKLIRGTPGSNMGFNGDACTFYIQQRFRNVRIIPTYKLKANDFIGSDGTRVLVSGQLQKSYTILFDYMDELSHDVVAALLMCKVVYIMEDGGSSVATGTRYFLVPQDYQPEWEKDGKLNLAMGRIQAIEYNQVKFTTNCQ